MHPKTPRPTNAPSTHRKKSTLGFRVFNIATMIIAVLGLMSYSFFLINDIKETRTLESATKIRFDKMDEDITILINERNHFKKIADSLLNAKDTVSIPTISSNRFIKLEKGVEDLNKIILDNPEKAISIPLLKSEILNQKEQNQMEFVSLRHDISRVYDMNKWIIGGVVALFLGILSLSAGNLFNRNKRE